jgi:hypothetical protein
MAFERGKFAAGVNVPHRHDAVVGQGGQPCALGTKVRTNNRSRFSPVSGDLSSCDRVPHPTLPSLDAVITCGPSGVKAALWTGPRWPLNAMAERYV